MNTNRIQRGQLTHNFFLPEVHLLAGKLIPIVLTVHLVVHELIGVTSLDLHKGAARTYTNECTQ